MTKYDGLKLMLQFYALHGQLLKVAGRTGVSHEKLQRFLDGDDCLSNAEEKRLRKPLKEFGGMATVN